MIPSDCHNDIEKIASFISDKTAAIMLEPIQGEGGINVFANSLLEALSKLCKQREIALIFDEVQCGIGRTGKLFHYLWSKIKPDIISSAKGLGGGYPLSACITNEHYGSCMMPGSHGGTYGGNPLAMQIGNAVIDEVLRDGFCDEIITKGNLLKSGLEKLQNDFPEIITEVKGEGLLLGLKIANDYVKLAHFIRNQRVLTIPASNDVIRVMPPLIVKKADIEEGLLRIRQALEIFHKEEHNG